MGKVVEKLKLTNAFDTRRKLEIEAVVDSEATMLVLPLTAVRRLNLRKRTTVTVRYANGKTAIRPVYGVVQLQIGKRVGDFDVLAEDDSGQALVGQIVLEQLDLIVDPRKKRLIPNPQSPDIPMVEIL